MASSSKRDPVLVLIELAGGNDSLNSVVPYGDPLYMDNRVGLRITPEQVLPINDYVGFNPAMEPIKRLYDEGKVAIVQGIGYPNHTLSHFRSMDIWHTCEPDKMEAEGWLGRAMRELDPNADNVVTGVNFGRGLPKALVSPGVPVATVGNLETYGVLTGIQGQDQRSEALEVFAKIYSPTMGRDMVGEYISQTGMDALKGADILSTALDKYSSTVEYANNEVAQYMKNIAQVHLADLGTRILYTTNPYNAFDTPRQTVGGPRQGMGPGGQCRRRLLSGPEGAQCQSGRGDHAVQRVWQAGQGERLGYRPRRWRRSLCGR